MKGGEGGDKIVYRGVRQFQAISCSRMKRIFRVVLLVAISALFVLGCDPVGPSAGEGPGEPPDEPVGITPISPGFHDQSEKISGETYEHWLFISRLAPGAPIRDAQTAHESYAGIPVGPDTTYRYGSFALDFSSVDGSDGGPAGSLGWKQSGGKRDIRILMKSPEGKLIQVINAGIPATPEAEDTFKDAVAAAFGLDASMMPALGGAESSMKTYDPALPHADPSKSGCATGESTVYMEWMWNDQNGYHMDGIVVCVRESLGDENPEEGRGGGALGGVDEPSRSLFYLSETLRNYGGFDATGPGSCVDCGGEEEEPAEVPVSKAEVVALIREECSNVPGVTLPGDDGRLGDYFESSVRKSLNDALPEDRKFNYDLPDTDTHPRLTADVDGYATAVTVDGAPLNQFLSSILEAKFSERPSSGLSSDQWQDHIDDLSRSYNEMRNEIADDEYTIAKPQYLIVTNSQFSDIGDLGGDESIRIPSYAANKNVNVMHLRVSKNAYGQYRLSGDLIGTADTLSFLSDLLKDIDIPFSVECDKNR